MEVGDISIYPYISSIIIILILDLIVCESVTGRSTEAIRPALLLLACMNVFDL